MSLNGTTWDTPNCCKGCFYRIAPSNGVSICDYACATGKLRNCPVEECPHYTKKKKRKKTQIWLKGL